MKPCPICGEGLGSLAGGAIKHTQQMLDTVKELRTLEPRMTAEESSQVEEACRYGEELAARMHAWAHDPGPTSPFAALRDEAAEWTGKAEALARMIRGSNIPGPDGASPLQGESSGSREIDPHQPGGSHWWALAPAIEQQLAAEDANPALRGRLFVECPACREMEDRTPATPPT